MRSAISPRLAMSTLLKIGLSPVDFEEYLSVFDGRAIGRQNRNDAPGAATTDGIADSERFYVRKFAIALQEVSGRWDRAAQPEDPNKIRFDRIKLDRRHL